MSKPIWCFMDEQQQDEGVFCTELFRRMLRLKVCVFIVHDPLINICMRNCYLRYDLHKGRRFTGS